MLQMRKLYLIGIGAGNPEYVTVQAIKALNVADIFFFLNKGDAKDELLQIRREICERYIEGKPYRIVEIEDPVRDAAIVDYSERVENWHEQRSILCEESLQKELSEDECGAFLVWGDPSLYDSTLRLIKRILDRGRVAFDYEVIPGITSVQALAARHRITLNGIGEAISITTGRQLADRPYLTAENTVVMLDGDCAFTKVLEDDVQIFWGAYLGTAKEILLSGDLTEMADLIEKTRKEARVQNGWIMDTYLLSKSPPES
jgi:precorrin-6A synthase